MSFIYVASPYTHPDASVREQRFDAVSEFTSKLIKGGMVAYSPIAHSHPLAVRYDIRGDFDFWMPQNYGMLCKASRVIVLTLDGWKESVGVQAEIAFAEQCGLPVDYTNDRID